MKSSPNSTAISPRLAVALLLLAVLGTVLFLANTTPQHLEESMDSETSLHVSTSMVEATPAQTSETKVRRAKFNISPQFGKDPAAKAPAVSSNNSTN